MTIKLGVAAGMAKAQITTISLPSELGAGKDVTGSIVLTNIGDAAGKLRLAITTTWDLKNYEGISPSPIGVGGIFTVTVPAGLIVMPSKDAVITLTGQHESAPGSGTWITDDTKTH